MLMVALAMQAQLKVAPKMQKGLEKVFTTVTTTNIPGQKAVTITTDTKYAVSDATAGGYVVDVTVTDVAADVTPDNIAGQLLQANAEVLKDITVRVGTNKDGKVERIVNYAELQPKIDKVCGQIVENMFKKVPDLSQRLSRDVLKQQLAGAITEETLINSMRAATSGLVFNGKTLMTGAQEEFVNDQGLKMKRMYFVTGKNVVAKSSMNMSKDELKALVIAQVEKMMPDQASMIKDNIDQLMDSGMLKMEMDETANYELQDDGWIKSITVDTTSKTMGQNVTSHAVVTAK